MERIYPLTDEHLQHIIGMPVCAVMRDGLRYVGIAESCRSGRLILADPAYGRVYSNQRAGQSASLSQEEHTAFNESNEQKQHTQRTISNKKKKAVRGKKQIRQPLAEVTSTEALSTNYAPDGHNPAGRPPGKARSQGSGLHLDDIFLLFLIV